jgi:hypothetical protein
MDEAGLRPDVEELAANQRGSEAALAPYAEETLQKLFVAFRDLGARQGAQTALMLLEIPTDNRKTLEVFSSLRTMAEEIDMPVLDFEGVYADVADRDSLWIVPWDSHTNVAGHRILADAFYDLLLENGLVPTGAASD